MRSLRAVAQEREFDNAAFDTYVRNEWLSQDKSAASSNVVIDSLMCPGYKYSPIKSSGKLSKNLVPKAEKFYDKLFLVFDCCGDGDFAALLRVFNGVVKHIDKHLLDA